jgi:hypothetical protein
VYIKNTDVVRRGADQAFIEAKQKLEAFLGQFRTQMNFKESDAGLTSDPELDRDACISLSKFVAWLWLVDAGHTKHLPQLTEFVETNKAIQMSVFEVLGARKTMERAREAVVKRTAFPMLPKKDQLRFLLRLLYRDEAAKITRSVTHDELHESTESLSLPRWLPTTTGLITRLTPLANVMLRTESIAYKVAANKTKLVVYLLGKKESPMDGGGIIDGWWKAFKVATGTAEYEPVDSEKLLDEMRKAGTDVLHDWSSDESGTLVGKKLVALYDPSAKATDIAIRLIRESTILEEIKTSVIDDIKRREKAGKAIDMLDIIFAVNSDLGLGVEYTVESTQYLIEYYHAKIKRIAQSRNEAELLAAVEYIEDFAKEVKARSVISAYNLARIMSDALSELESLVASDDTRSSLRGWSRRIMARVWVDVTYHLNELKTKFPEAISEKKKVLYQTTEDIVAKMNLEGLEAKKILDAVKKELTNEAAHGDIADGVDGVGDVCAAGCGGVDRLAG